MTEPTPIDLPAGLRWVKLVCRLGRLVTDSAADADAHPDLLPVGGTLTLAASPSRVRIQEADGRWRSVEVAGRTYTIRADGELVDNEGRVGVYIPDPASLLVEPQGYAITAVVKPTGGTEWRVTVGGGTVLPDVVDLVAVSSVGSTSPSVTASFDARLYALETGGGVDVGQVVEDYLVANPPAAVADATTTTKGILRLAGDLGGTATAPTVPGLAGKADADHGHAIGDVTGLLAALDGKQASGSYAAATHDHTAADIDSGAATDGHILTADGAGGAAWEAPPAGGGGSGSGIELVSGTVTLGSSGTPIREFYATGSVTINGVTFPAGTAVVFRRDTTDAWGYIVVDGWTAITPPEATADAPTFTDPSGTAGDEYTIPAVTGVIYKVDGVTTAAGTYPGSGTVTVTAEAEPGWTLTGTSSWTHTFSTATDPVEVTATAPTWTDDTTNGGGTWTTPTIAGVTYSPASGTATPGQTVTVTATAQAGYQLSGTSSWSHTFPTAGAPNALADAITALSPAGYWKLDETSGTQAADSSGNAHHGSLGGSYVLAGQDGALKLTFSGYVEVPDHADLSAVGKPGWSVFALVSPASLGGTSQFVASKAASGQFEWGMAVRSGVIAGTYWNPAAGGERSFSSAAGPTAGGWQAIAWAADPPASDATAAIYLGSTAQTVTPSGTGTGYAKGTAPVRIGLRATGSGGYGGGVRHVAIFPKKLTAGEVTTLVNAARADGLIP